MAGPVFRSKQTGTQEESAQGAEDFAVHMDQFMDHIVEEVGEGGGVALMFGLTAGSAVLAGKRHVAVATGMQGIHL